MWCVAASGGVRRLCAWCVVCCVAWCGLISCARVCVCGTKHLFVSLLDVDVVDLAVVVGDAFRVAAKIVDLLGFFCC